MIVYIIAGWALLTGIVVWSLCRMAALADEAIERGRERRS